MPSVLIVDDSDYMRGKIRGILSSEGYEIREAEDGFKGLELVHACAPDCVVLDLIMPELDGLKILKALAGRKEPVPVIVVTADIQESVRMQCLELGATAFLHKPPREAELRSAVAAALKMAKER